MRSIVWNQGKEHIKSLESVARDVMVKVVTKLLNKRAVEWQQSEGGKWSIPCRLLISLFGMKGGGDRDFDRDFPVAPITDP